ncbi:MAG: L-seryl-tRNA(Sec) selenium transferase [Gaiellales bacterium]|nr:MAG: L-seryl-tRNA(Sec) selenium transferase [Gaiellales bacterium]
MPELAGAIDELGRGLVVDSARAVVERLRAGILAGEDVSEDALAPAAMAPLVEEAARAALAPSLTPLVNATGVVVHTNLGRSVLAPEAMAAVERVSGAYSNLEYDLAAGKRGSRHDHITDIIVSLTGAGNALVVNNNAAAVLLALYTFAAGKEVIVSRGELIEIGGSFRIPDIMASSSAKLVEVGTTNKTKLADYEKAITDETAMLLLVHSSNYKIVGFTAEVPIADLVKLGHERGLMVVHDLGSGVLVEGMAALSDEPSVFDSLAAGADIVTFSGDKLLGGPQAGIVVGKDEHIRAMKAHPMARALRVDKMTLAALQATLALYLRPEEAIARIPTLRMLDEGAGSLMARAGALGTALMAAAGDAASFAVEEDVSKVGGGALPLVELPTAVCAISPKGISVDELAARLRDTDPIVIGRIHRERLLLDARTILPGQEAGVVAAVKTALG